MSEGITKGETPKRRIKAALTPQLEAAAKLLLRCPKCRRLSVRLDQRTGEMRCIWKDAAGGGCVALHTGGGEAPWRKRLPGGVAASARRAREINTPRLHVYRQGLGEWSRYLTMRLPHRFAAGMED